MKIINLSGPEPNPSTVSSAKPLPPLDFSTLKKAIESFVPDPIIRFEVNTDLFNEIVTHISQAKRPLFKFVKPQVISYIHFDSIPIIHIPDQVEPLKIIKKRRKHENQTFRKKDSSKTR